MIDKGFFSDGLRMISLKWLFYISQKFLHNYFGEKHESENEGS